MHDDDEDDKPILPGKPRQLSSEYEWQKARIGTPDGKPAAGCSMLRGYGPAGNFSMYVPSAVVGRKIRFVDGAPVVELVGTCLDIPAVRAARDEVLACAARRVPLAELFADVTLVKYSAALLAVTYTLDDDDLTMLHSGRGWYEPIIVHAMGGADSVDTLRRMDPARVSEIVARGEHTLTGATLAAAGVVSPNPAAVSVEYSDDGPTAAAVATVVAADEVPFDPTLL